MLLVVAVSESSVEKYGSNNGVLTVINCCGLLSICDVFWLKSLLNVLCE